ncbi:MAG: hypothetical protein ACRDZ3_01435, partial [Acidimicrobiia bacterium]
MRPRLTPSVAVALILFAALLVPDRAQASVEASTPPVADSATLSSSILSRGRLFDAGGRPAAGVLRLYGWPRWTGT